MPKRLRKVAAFSLVLAFMLIGLSCSQSEKTPAPSATYAPTPAIDSGEFSIAYISSNDTAYNTTEAKILGHLQDILNNQGWNVRLMLKTVESSNSENTEAFDIVSADYASGTACDGYFVSDDDAHRLLQAGLVKNLASIFPDAAPILYERYRQALRGEVAGIPVYVRYFPKGLPMVFYLRKDISEGLKTPIRSVGELLSLLETGRNKQKIGVRISSVSGYWSGIFDVWAGEMGYYPLSAYGMSGFLYARSTDEQCAPVPIEAIEGFAAFADRYHASVSAGRIADLFEMQDSTDDSIVGFIGPVSAFINPVYLINNHRSGSDYLAFPLEGSFCPKLPDDDPIVYEDIAVSVASHKEMQIAKFIQWATSGPDSYDLVNFGQKGVDYRIQDNRLEPLLQGKAITSDDWNKGSILLLGDLGLFYDDTFTRKMIYSPINYDEVSAIPPTYPPIWSIDKLRGQPYECKSVFQDIDDKMAQTLQARSDFIYGMIDEKFSNGKERSQCLPGLLAMKDDTDKLVDAYAGRIKELLGQQGKGS